MARRRDAVLVVDRDRDAARALVAFLREHEFEVFAVHDGESAFNVLARERIDCLICELRAPRIDGFAVLALALERAPELCAVLVHEGAELAMAVEAMRRGAWDLQSKPLHFERLLATLQKGLQHQALAARLHEVEADLDRRFGLEALTGSSRAIERVQDQVRRIAPTRAPVLLEGEPGSGKSVVARAIHRNSTRKDARFVWVSCATLLGAAPDEFDADLFGVASGAPGGPRRGRLEYADGGTLFLDEVELLPASAQARLLRVLHERAVDRIGGGEPVRADVRVIAASTKDIAGEVATGRFREDLYYRIAVVRITVPPLRERREDLPVLVERFVRELARRHNKRVRGVTRGVMERLRAHDWPGNVTELKDTLEAMVVVANGRGPLEVSNLPEALRGTPAPASRLEVAVGMTVDEAERALIEATLRHTGGDKTAAAAMLGIGLRTLYRKLEAYGQR